MNVIHPIPYGEPVTLLRTDAGGTDEYGNDVLTEVTTAISNVAVWPRTGTETDNGDARDQTVIGLTLLIPPGIDVQSTDRFMVRGNRYEVAGEPGVWRSYLTGTLAGTEVNLTRIEG